MISKIEKQVHNEKLWDIIYSFPEIILQYVVGLLFFKIFVCLFIYLFLTVLGLRCCAWAFSRCGEQGLLFVAVRGLLIAVASLVAEHRL